MEYPMDILKLIDLCLPDVEDGRVKIRAPLLAVSALTSIWSLKTFMESIHMTDFFACMPNTSIIVVGVVTFIVMAYLGYCYKKKNFQDKQESAYNSVAEAYEQGIASDAYVDRTLLGASEFGLEYKIGVFFTAIFGTGLSLLFAYLAGEYGILNMAGLGTCLAWAVVFGVVAVKLVDVAVTHPQEAVAYTEKNVVAPLKATVDKYVTTEEEKVGGEMSAADLIALLTKAVNGGKA